MDEVDFEHWWQEFSQQHEFGKDGSETIRHLQRYVRDLPALKRETFLDELLNLGTNAAPSAGIALEVMVSEAMPRHIQTICDHVTPLRVVGSATDESLLVAFMRVLASDRSGQCLQVVESYLLDREIGPYWESLPWSLWPHHADLFSRAWLRYFSTVPSSRWRETAVVQAFLFHADAIACLKDLFLKSSTVIWNQFRDAIAAQCTASWLSKEQQESVSAVISS